MPKIERALAIALARFYKDLIFFRVERKEQSNQKRLYYKTHKKIISIPQTSLAINQSNKIRLLSFPKLIKAKITMYPIKTITKIIPKGFL